VTKVNGKDAAQVAGKGDWLGEDLKAAADKRT
jgi:hypothetical protein